MACSGPVQTFLRLQDRKDRKDPRDCRVLPVFKASWKVAHPPPAHRGESPFTWDSTSMGAVLLERLKLPRKMRCAMEALESLVQRVRQVPREFRVNKD